MTAAHDSAERLGVDVEVLSRFDGRWVTGFVIEARLEHGLYVLRRISDGSVLPVPFTEHEVRPTASSRTLAS